MESKADVVLRIMARRRGVEVRLDKHPTVKTKKIVFGAEVFGMVSLDDFAKGAING
jgi:hypothetical protein